MDPSALPTTGPPRSREDRVSACNCPPCEAATLSQHHHASKPCHAIAKLGLTLHWRAKDRSHGARKNSGRSPARPTSARAQPLKFVCVAILGVVHCAMWILIHAPARPTSARAQPLEFVCVAVLGVMHCAMWILIHAPATSAATATATASAADTTRSLAHTLDSLGRAIALGCVAATIRVIVQTSSSDCVGEVLVIAGITELIVLTHGSRRV